MNKIKIRYVVLAKTIPEYSKRDKTLYTCSLGYSPELGLIRVYPLPITGMDKWGLYEITVEKNKLDTRTESWKLATNSRFEQWNGAQKDIKFVQFVKPDYIVNILAQRQTQSIKHLNSNKFSIGVLTVSEYRLYWAINKRYKTSSYGLFEDVELAEFTNFTKDTKSKEARIYFKDATGEHDLQYNEWQIYEFQRKFKASDEAFKNLNNKNLLLVGNMHSYRNNWLALSLFFNQNTQHTLF